MRLIRWGKAGEEKPGIYLNGNCYDVSTHFSDYNEEFFTNGGVEQLASLIETTSFALLPKDIRFGAPVARPSKIVCIVPLLIHL